VFKDREEGEIRKIEILSLTIMKQRNEIMVQGKRKYRNKEGKRTRCIALTLLKETRLVGEEYGGQSEAVVPLMAVVCNCKTDTDGTGDNGYGQPQAVAESCDVAIPCHVGVVG
jgi:hypothetical protein